MALKLKASWNGIDCEYWKIIGMSQNAVDNITQVILGLYVNKEQRDKASKGFVNRQVINIPGVDLTRAAAYQFITTSKPKVITPEVPEVKDADGNVTQEAVPAKTEETNPWALAESV